MQPLPGFVPVKAQVAQSLRIPTQIDSATRTNKPSLRADFAHELETRLTGWVGRPDSETFKNLKPVVEPCLKDDPQSKNLSFDIDKLPEKSKDDLVKLQHAAEGIEAIFVKKLLSQMRSVTFNKDKGGPMAEFAKDMMDQTLAEQSAKGRSSLGIAKMIFLDSAQPLVRAAIAKSPGNLLDKK